MHVWHLGSSLYVKKHNVTVSTITIHLQHNAVVSTADCNMTADAASCWSPSLTINAGWKSRLIWRPSQLKLSHTRLHYD